MLTKSCPILLHAAKTRGFGRKLSIQSEVSLPDRGAPDMEMGRKEMKRITICSLDQVY